MNEGNQYQGGQPGQGGEFRLPPVRGSRASQEMQFGQLWPIAVIVVALFWLASGFYIVSPGELGVVRQFGREVGKTGPGLQYRIPWPVQQVDVVNVEAVRRVEIGFRTNERGQAVTVANESLMLTGDENIVQAQVIVQYRVRDASQYLFRLRDPDDALRAATEVALRGVVGGTTIDDILTVGRPQAQEETRAFLQRLMDDYNSGILVLEVRLQVVDPPDQVKDAFHEVVRAREDRERLINQARGYREDILPRARGQAQEIIRAAEAYRERRVIEAQGDTSKFVALLEEYSKSKDVTRIRLHLEVVERVLANTEKILMDGNAGSNLLPFLPVRGQEHTSRPAQSASPTQQPTAAEAEPAPQSPQPTPTPFGGQ